ncbi:hypothetical protein Tco_0281675 [Tanacetum coccineum]
MVTNRKSNSFDSQKDTEEPHLSDIVDILRNTNFFRAFSASASVLAIYIQQTLDKTPVDPLTHLSYLRLVTRLKLNFVNQLGKTSGGDNQDKAQCKQCCEGIVTQTNVIIRTIMRRVTQGSDILPQAKASHKASLKDPKKKAVPLLIPYGRIVQASNLNLPTKACSTQEAHKTTTPRQTTKPPSSKQPKSPTKKPSKRKPPQKVRKGKPSFQLVDEDDEAQQEPVPQGEVDSSTVTSGRSRGYPFVTEDQLDQYPGKVHEAAADQTVEPSAEDRLDSSISWKSKTLITLGINFLNDKPTEDDHEKSKVVDESDSPIPITSHQTVTSTPPVIAPFIDFSYPKPSSQVTTPPINTEATSITTTLPEITPFIALQLRVAKLEQDMSEVKKIDHSAAVLASIKS